jgi:hypothetical protein
VDSDSDSPSFGPNGVVAEYHEEELLGDEEEEEVENVVPTMGEKTPQDPRLEGLVWKDDGAVSNDQRILDVAPKPGHVQPHSVVVQVVSEVPSPGHRLGGCASSTAFLMLDFFSSFERS